MPGSEHDQPLARRSKRRLVAAAVAAIALAGCGSSQTATGHNQLGPGIATAPATGSPAAAPPNGTTTAGASTPRREPHQAAIHLPPPPSVTAPRSRAILTTATRFARAYLQYQIGRDSQSVRHAIQQTCTPRFARRLLSRPVSVPDTQRDNPAAQTATLDKVRYTGPASLGPGPTAQVVIAPYHAVARRGVAGQLTIELIRHGSGWRVEALG